VPATLRSFAPHQMEKEKWQYALDYSVWAALRREQCDIAK
jgi:hypothetical protein